MSDLVSPASSEITSGQVLTVLPLGAWEQHGPHLPLDTDTVIVTSVVKRGIADSNIPRHHVIVAPVLAITASDEHAGFPGSLSTGTRALVDSVVSICRSTSSWSAGVLIANGHGGNFDALKDIASALDYEKITYSIWSLPSYTGADMHAGKTETSLMLHLAPHMVRRDAIPPVDVREIDMTAMLQHGIQAVSPSGVLGAPAAATAEHGQEVLALYTESFVDRLRMCASQWLNVGQ
jgi:creatinine amidohydrolase